jgi:hypothetical protein
MQLFARGKSDQDEVKTQNDQWILCITNFDTSGLLPERSAVSEVIMRKLVEKISAINYRTRISSEYAYYEEVAWTQTRSNAAKAIAAKQEERSLLLYKGESNWRYRNTLSRLDSEIEKLYAELEEIENNVPLINKEPVFNLFSGNMELQFPEAPVASNEHRFCTSQKTDAVLIGSVSDYHGRFIVTLRLYTIFTRSFVWEDRIIFSHDDMDNAMEEITRRLMILLSGNRPAAVAIDVQPEGALVLINRSFAGRGDTSVIEFPPGRITVTASSPDYESIAFETDLAPGELSRISINLNPVEFGELEITGNTKGISGSIYLGAMYIGEAPLTLRLPLNYMEYIEIETVDGQTGRIIFQTPDTEYFSGSIPIRTAAPPRDGRVDRARRMFYWSIAATWISGIATWISYHSYDSYTFAYNSAGAHNQRVYDDAQRMYNIYNGSLIALGSFVVLDLILLTRYIYVANKGSTAVMTGRN